MKNGKAVYLRDKDIREDAGRHLADNAEQRLPEQI